MPVKPPVSYPGVYVQEISSGVRTITGVATSIAAFIGDFRRGPLNKALQIFNSGDLVREFGDLYSLSETSYAIQQFFLNGGSEAWVVRTVNSTEPAEPARVTIAEGLIVDAVSPGDWGNFLRVRIDYDTIDPSNENLFNLTVAEYSVNALGGPPVQTEVFRNLSIGSEDRTYVETVINSDSRLIRIIIEVGADRPLQNGTLSGDLTSFPELTAPRPAVDITIDDPNDPEEPPTTATAILRRTPTNINEARSDLESAIRASNFGNSAFSRATVEVVQNNFLRILAGPTNNPNVRVTFASSSGVDPTVDHLGLDAASITLVEVLRSGAIDLANLATGSLTVTTSDGRNVTLTIEITDSIETIEDARLALETAIRDEQSLSDIQVGASGTDRLLVLSELADVSLAFEETAEDATTVTNWGLDAAVVEPLPSGILSGDLNLAGLEGAPTLSRRLNVQINDDPEPVTLTLVIEQPTLTTIAENLQALLTASAEDGGAGIAASIIPYISGEENRLLLLLEDPDLSISFAAGSDEATVVQLLLDEANAQVSTQESVFAGGVSSSLPPDAAALIGDRSEKSGIFALEEVDLFNILCIPDTAKLDVDGAFGVLAQAIDYCADRRAMMIVDPPEDEDDIQEIKAWKDAIPRGRNAAIYYPRVLVPNPENEFRLGSFGASGTMAGVWARTDGTRGVWKAPAGSDATLTGVRAIARTLTDAENGTLNPLGINCLRSFPVYGRVAWGARTLNGADILADEYKYIPVRRLALFIEESLFRGLKWVVFEPNDEPLWAQIRLNVGAFMNNLFRQGAFQGSAARDAYFVKCDKETTTQNDINLGIVNIVVGFAPLKPAEFVIIYLQQMAGQIEV